MSALTHPEIEDHIREAIKLANLAANRADNGHYDYASAVMQFAQVHALTAIAGSLAILAKTVENFQVNSLPVEILK